MGVTTVQRPVAGSKIAAVATASWLDGPLEPPKTMTRPSLMRTLAAAHTACGNGPVRIHVPLP